MAYGLGKGPRSRLLIRQLSFPSVFNTYLYKGLPPGPICNPGRKSIEAALNPTDGLNELYFVARGQGRHWFAETYAQHLENIRRVRGPTADSLPARADSMAKAASLAREPGRQKASSADRSVAPERRGARQEAASKLQAPETKPQTKPQTKPARAPQGSSRKP